MDEKSTQAGPVLVALLLLLPSLYVGAYYATVDRYLPTIRLYNRGDLEFFPYYKVGHYEDFNGMLVKFFSPVHRLDLLIRPSYWTDDSEWSNIGDGVSRIEVIDEVEPTSPAGDGVVNSLP